MDNLSHTVIGVLVGEALARGLPAGKSGMPSDRRRGLFVSVMALGSNLPDLDFVPSAISGSKLGYLLEHRGYTHTIVGAALIAVAILVACEAWMRLRKHSATRHDRLMLLGVAFLASLLHIAMDFGNSYGVHPFWPLHNGWWYGDSVFIVEPLFWAAAAPLAFLLKTMLARLLIVLLLACGIAVAFLTAWVPAPLAVTLTVLTIGMLAAGRYLLPRTAIISGIAVWLATTTLFALAGRVVAGEIAANARRTGTDVLHDHVLTPMPVNPFCWDVLLVQSSSDTYSLRQGTFSLAPTWLPASKCPSRMAAAAQSAPTKPRKVAAVAQVHWRGEVTLSVSQLRALAAASCQADALLRFARAPFFTATLIGDLRYDREPEAGFAEIDFRKDACPPSLPPWTPPRADLLELTREFDRSLPRR